MTDVSGIRHLGVWDYVVSGALLLVTVAIGFYHVLGQRRKSGITEFLMAGRSMGTLPVALSVLATYFSAISTLGVPVETFYFGTQQCMYSLSYMAVIPVSAHYLLPVFHQAGVTSAYEYLEMRFTSSLRKAASVIYILQTTLFTVVVLYAPSLSLSQVAGLGVWTSVGLIGVTCIAYTALGGMRAVLWADTLQVVIMFGSSLVISIVGCIDMGGFEAVWSRARMGRRLEFFNMDFDPTLRQSFWSITVGGFFTWLNVYGISQSMVQRYLTTKTLKIAQSALWWNLPGLVLMTFLNTMTGLIIYARYWDCDPVKSGVISSKDQLLPLYVMDTFGSLPGLPGLFIAAISCATLSTMSSNLNGLTAVTLEDFIRPAMPNLTEKRATLLAKLIPVVYGGLAIALVALADQLGNIVQAFVSISGMVGGPLLGVFLLGFFAPWANSIGALVGLISGFALTGCIVVGHNLSKLSWPTLPIDSDSCPWFNETTTPMSTQYTPANQTEISEKLITALPLFQITYQWYSAISCITVLVIGAIVSGFTKKCSSRRVDPALLSPAVRWMQTGYAQVATAPPVNGSKTNGKNGRPNSDKV